MLLKELPVGARGRIMGIKNTHPEYRRRLIMLGATPGASFEILRIAPLGDPIELRVRSSCISIRRAEAEVVEVEVSK